MGRLARALALVACAARGVFGDVPRRAVFLHVNQCGGGSFMAWMTGYSQWCKKVPGQPCGVLERVCKFKSFSEGHTGGGEDQLYTYIVDPSDAATPCGDWIRDIVERNCSFVELHH